MLSRLLHSYYRTFGASGRLEHFTEDGAEYAYTMTAFIEGGTGNFEGVTGLISYLGTCIRPCLSSLQRRYLLCLIMCRVWS